VAKHLLDVNDQLGRHATSWYAATATSFPELPPLGGDCTADVAIIGAGYTGLSTALHLAKRDFNVVVLEAHRVGWGASGRNGGQVGCGQRIAQDELEGMIGNEDAKLAFQIGQEATDTVRELINAHTIQCDWQNGVIEAFHKSSHDKWGEREVEHMAKRYGYTSMEYLPPTVMAERVASPDYSAGVIDHNAGHIHPLNYARGLARAALDAGAQIFELTRILDIQDGPRLRTHSGTVKANHVVLAANGYLGKLDADTADRVMPINNFMVATEPLGEILCEALIRNRAAVYDSRFVVNYFRTSADNRMLFGGGENYRYRFPEDIGGMVRRCMLTVFPQLEDMRIDYAWGGTLGITPKRLPHLEFRKNGIVSVSGYSGSGIHMATMAGKLAAEAIGGQMERFDIMAKLPTPKFPGGRHLRWPLLPLALSWYALKDRL